MQIRLEDEHDRDAVHALNTSAFDSAAEADLVDLLRREAQPVTALVARESGALVGHIMFSHVELAGHPGLELTGLAPLAVASAHRRKGIGAALVRGGLAQCEQLGFGAVVVLGHPGYYSRFGFVPAARFGIRCEFKVPEVAFMLVELRPGYLRRASGTVRYHRAFGEL